MENVSKDRFVSAMQQLRPRAQVLQFLKAHYESPGHTLNAARLAKAAGFDDYRDLYLHYESLALQIGSLVGDPEAAMSLLAEVVESTEPIQDRPLVMRPAFAEALKQANWL
jgi:hypothetical protein